LIQRLQDVWGNLGAHQEKKRIRNDTRDVKHRD
jgi:hypothetical protein